MGIGVQKIMLLGLIILTVSCGIKTNAKPLVQNSSELAALSIEKQCATGVISSSPVAVEITNLYNYFLVKYPLSFFIIPGKSYDYKTPLIINLDDLSTKMSVIKNKISDEVFFEANVTNIAIELYYLYQSSIRYEGNKCAFSNLATKKTNDLRPYMSLVDFCSKKDDSAICTARSLENLSPDEAFLVEEKTVQLCQLLNPESANCKNDFLTEKENNNLAELVGTYQKRFEEERYNKLFMLRDSHLKFSCINDAEKIVMTVKVSSLGWELTKLRGLVEFVSESWSRENFELKIELVTNVGSDVIEIIPTNNPISRVSEDNNRQVYLSQLLDSATAKKVLVHEFGHVLGFPDCYTEFYDNQKKDLIYYEISNENTNIMCSLKSGVSVPDEYLNQLAQNSCLFN